MDKSQYTALRTGCVAGRPISAWLPVTKFARDEPQSTSQPTIFGLMTDHAQRPHVLGEPFEHVFILVGSHDRSAGSGEIRSSARPARGVDHFQIALVDLINLRAQVEIRVDQFAEPP